MQIMFIRRLLAPILFFLTVAGAIVSAQSEAPTGRVPPVSCSETSGERFVAILAGIEVPFRWVAPGCYPVGSRADEAERDEAEQRHEVELTRGFWIAETETTQAFYRAVTGENPSQFVGEARPVETVSWDDAVRFCDRLNERTSWASGRGLFGLPTEAQWEIACRAGTDGPFAGALERLAWSGEPNETGSTHPVGTKEPNHWGLFDMHGNLWEWCADIWHDYPTQKEIDPYTPPAADSSVRIDRGGCWDSAPQQCRSAWRGVYEHDRRGRYVGFRLVFTEEAPCLP